MPFHFDACTQSCSPLINGLVDDALRNASMCIDDSLLQVGDVANRRLSATCLDYALSSLCWKTPTQTVAHCTQLIGTNF